MTPDFPPFPHMREDSSGTVIKEDYPMSKEELLSHIMKSVRVAPLGPVWGRGKDFQTCWDPNVAHLQLQVQDEEEAQKKLDSSPSLTLSSPQISLAAAGPIHSRKASTVPESILSHKSARGRGTGSVSHVTFGDSASAVGPVTLASASASGMPVSSRGSQGGRGAYKHTSSSSYLGSTGYLETTSRGRESIAGGIHSQSMGSELSRGLSSSSGHASSAAPASRPSSSTSKDSRGYN